MAPAEGGEVVFQSPDGEEAVVFSSKMEKMNGVLDDDVINKVISAIGHCDSFTCYVYQKKKGDFQKKQVARVDNDIPDPDAVGSEVGGGSLQYMIKAKPKGGKGRPITSDFWVHLGDNYDDKAEDNRRSRMLKNYLPTPSSNSNLETKLAFSMLDKVLDSRSQNSGDSQLQMFKLIVDMQNSASERMERMLERMDKNNKEVLEKLASKDTGSDLTKTIALIGAIKEASSMFGGGESKSIVTEILEAATPILAPLMGRLGGGTQVPAQTIPAIGQESAVSPDQIISEITSQIDSLLDTFEKAGKLKKTVLRAKIRKDPSAQALLNSPAHLEKLRKNIGDEKFSKLIGFINER